MDARIVAVANLTPVYRRGLCEILVERGWTPTQPADVRAWATRDGAATVVLGIRGLPDLRLLSSVIRSAPPTVLVTLVTEGSAAWHARCLALGAQASLGMDADPAEIALALEGASMHQAVLPYDVAVHMARLVPQEQKDEEVDLERLAWLRRLAAGVTVDRLAEETGYSRRAMFRLLKALYADMGAGTRTEALLAAARRGLL